MMPPGDHQATVLIVDDEPVVLAVVAGILSRKYRVITATNGLDAIRKAEEYKADIHLLLSDFQMPYMSGVELATKLNHTRPGIPVLLMSGFPNGVLVLNEGWHFIAKPFLASQLGALVSGLIRASQPEVSPDGAG